MVPQTAPLVAAVVVLFSLGYFMMASLPFLLVRLDIKEVWRLFRGLFNVYFRVVGIAALLASMAFALSGHVLAALAMITLGVWASALRKPLLEQLDLRQAALQSGEAGAVRVLRVIHCGTMLANVAIVAALVSSLPVLVSGTP
ncbi:MAG: hypothetical protein WBF87_10585 [Mesorhizobium sp.]